MKHSFVTLGMLILVVFLIAPSASFAQRHGTPVSRCNDGEQVDVPKVEGFLAREAQQKLESLGLSVTIEEKHASLLPEGIVFGQDPRGGNVDCGATVTLQVSLGPAPLIATVRPTLPPTPTNTPVIPTATNTPIVVPATPVVVPPEPTPTDTPTPIPTTPPPDTPTPEPPPQVAVPNVIGADVTMAGATIRGAGLVPSPVKGECGDDGKVSSTSPVPGALVDPKTTITIYYEYSCDGGGGGGGGGDGPDPK